jgi:hypothetical protein
MRIIHRQIDNSSVNCLTDERISGLLQSVVFCTEVVDSWFVQEFVASYKSTVSEPKRTVTSFTAQSTPQIQLTTYLLLVAPLYSQT